MAGGCGCGGGQGLFTGGPGISVAGSGTQTNPRILTVVADPEMCEIVQDAAGSSLCAGNGLVYDDEAGCLGVKLSQKAGNTIRLGTDGGLWIGAEPNPVDARCGRTVDSLPDFACMPLFGPGRNLPYHGDRTSILHGMAAGADGIYMNVGVTCDRVAFVAANQALNEYPFEPAIGYQWRHTTAAQVRNIRLGWRSLQQPASTVWPGPLTLEEFLNITQGRAVAILNVTVLNAAEDQYLIEQLRRRCCERQVIVIGTAPAVLPRLAAYQEAGIDTGALAGGTGGTAAEVQGAGCRWAWLPVQADDDTVSTFVAAGLETVLWNSARRFHLERARRLGCRGFSPDDMRYQCNPSPCRLEKDPWCYDTPPTGQISDEEANGRFAGWQGGRYDDSDDPATDPPELKGPCGWEFSKAPENRAKIRQAITLGWACPIPGLDVWRRGYEIVWRVRFNSTAARTGGTGLIFGALDDRCPTRSDGGALDAGATGYSALFLHSNHGLQLRRLPSETGAPLAETRSISYPPFPGYWYRFKLRITPGEISFWQLDRDGEIAGVNRIDNIRDSTYRGGYLHLYKLNRFGTASWTPVDVAFRDLTINPIPEGG